MPPAPAKKPANAVDEFAPASRPVLRSVKRNALNRLTDEQKQLLEQFKGDDRPLRHLKQLSLPMTEADVVGLMHESVSDVAGETVLVAPFVFSDLFQSAQVAAQYIGDCLESGFTWKQIEGFLNQCLAAEPNGIVKGMKVQIKVSRPLTHCSCAAGCY